jgi:hypothetical protein
MFDLNTIISQALTQAVEQAIKPLEDRLSEIASSLDNRLSELEKSMLTTGPELTARIRALETWSAHTGQNLTDRVVAFEQRSPGIATSEDMMRHFESVMEATNQRIDVLESWHEDAITGDQVNHLIEEALNEIDWNEQVQEVLSGDMLEEAVNDAIDEMLSELRIARQ